MLCCTVLCCAVLLCFVVSLQGVVNELNKSNDVIKLVTNSLVKCHKQAVSVVGDGQLKPVTMVDGRYPHSDVSSVSFLTCFPSSPVIFLKCLKKCSSLML